MHSVPQFSEDRQHLLVLPDLFWRPEADIVTNYQLTGPHIAPFSQHRHVDLKILTFLHFHQMTILEWFRQTA